MDDTFHETSIQAITRPHPYLLRYYSLISLLWGPFCLIPLAVGTLRFRTLHYQFSNESVTMRWGGLTQHEVSVAYNRIQEIHLRSNVLERWLGLARIEVQTAGGSGRPELTLEGLRSYEHVRTFLYERARGEDTKMAVGTQQASLVDGQGEDNAALASALREVAAELRLVRQFIEAERKTATEPRS